MWSEAVDLSDWRQCAKGGQRLVYENPSFPGVLIKTVRTEARGKNGARIAKSWWRFLRKHRRFGAYMSFKREAEEYIEQVRKQEPGEERDLPIAAVHGFCQTSDGLGLVVERVSDASGCLAPTLGQLLGEGRFLERHFELVEDYFARCARLHIVMMDLNLDNLVVANRRGHEEIVCVDGTGDKSAVRIYSASRIANAVKLRRMEHRLIGKICRRMEVHSALPDRPARDRLFLEVRSEDAV